MKGKEQPDCNHGLTAPNFVFRTAYYSESVEVGLCPELVVGKEPCTGSMPEELSAAINFELAIFCGTAEDYG